MNRDWSQHLWGVQFVGAKGAGKMLLGQAWDDKRFEQQRTNRDVPIRALLFNSKREAAEWCKDKNEMWRVKNLQWTATPVRVRETVQVVE